MSAINGNEIMNEKIGTLCFKRRVPFSFLKYIYLFPGQQKLPVISQERSPASSRPGLR